MNSEDLDLVLDQLSNNESESDIEMLVFLTKETEIDKKVLASIIKNERSYFLKTPVPAEDGVKRIMGYFY